MRGLITAALALGPSAAFAHHEAVVVSVLPALTPWILAACAGGLAVWRGWRHKDDDS